MFKRNPGQKSSAVYHFPAVCLRYLTLNPTVERLYKVFLYLFEEFYVFIFALQMVVSCKARLSRSIYE